MRLTVSHSATGVSLLVSWIAKWAGGICGPLPAIKYDSVLEGEPVCSRSVVLGLPKVSDGVNSMQRSILAALFVLPGLSACGGLGQSNPGELPKSASAPLGPDATVREIKSDSGGLVALVAAGVTYRLYVANSGNNSITVYNNEASGNKAPIATIIGSNTQLDSPGQLSEDASGNLYVANSSSILVFANGANGNVAPVRVIAGPLTGLSTHLWAATVDRTTQDIFAVAEVAGTQDGNSELIRFAPNASGDEAPLAISNGGPLPAHELASDSTRKNIIDAAGPICCETPSEGVETWTKQFPNGGYSKLLYRIEAFYNSGIADDPTTKTYLVSGNDGLQEGIFRLDEDTVGDGAYQGQPVNFTPAAVSEITSETCGSQLALGNDRNIYVAHNSSLGCPTDAVYVYQHDASGNASPLRVLTGSATQLALPTGIYQGK